MRFTSENFNESLAEGRLTRVEVDDTLKRCESDIGGYGEQCKAMWIFFTWMFCWMAVYTIGMIFLDGGDERHGDDHSKDKPEDKKETSGV
jgi:hypothetical protein